MVRDPMSGVVGTALPDEVAAGTSTVTNALVDQTPHCQEEQTLRSTHQHSDQQLQ
jgi:hypothetical protein